MKNPFLGYGNLFIIILSIYYGTFSSADAQQQQYANAYTFWEFGVGADDVVNIDQKIWIARSAPGTQWVITWKWTADPAHGGYLGFNTDENGTGQALFSLWNASEATGGVCKEFGGEGVGWSCRTPFEIRTDVQYLLRLVRTKSDNDGAWWGAWIYEDPDSPSASEFFLGEIKVSSDMNVIRGNSINNFSEYYGKVMDRCSSIPLSILGVAPPSANRDEDGNYSRTSKFNGSSKPQDNPCKTGEESEGVLFKVENYAFGSDNGALIFLGGSRDTQTLSENINEE